MVQELILEEHHIQRQLYLIYDGLLALFTKAIVIELIKQNVVIDCVEGFFMINEYSTR